MRHHSYFYFLVIPHGKSSNISAVYVDIRCTIPTWVLQIYLVDIINQAVTLAYSCCTGYQTFRNLIFIFQLRTLNPAVYYIYHSFITSPTHVKVILAFATLLCTHRNTCSGKHVTQCVWKKIKLRFLLISLGIPISPMSNNKSFFFFFLLILFLMELNNKS